MKHNTYNMLYTHDGNKNVSEVLFANPINGIGAHYEYAPFGAITRTSKSTPISSVDFINLNPFRFSSEFHDPELGLVYYNYRHYNPTDGRWLSRDPIAESGGYNLYASCKNNIMTTIDYLGEVSLETKLISLYVFKWLSHYIPFVTPLDKGPYLFDDEENQMASATKDQILSKLEKITPPNNELGKWEKNVIFSKELDNSTPAIKVNSTQGLTLVIHGAHKVFVSGNYEYCYDKPKKIQYRNLDLLIHWEDEMDANNPEELKTYEPVLFDYVEVPLDKYFDEKASFFFIIQYRIKSEREKL